MDIALIRKEANEYLKSSQTGLHILGVNEEKRQIEVASRDNNFTCFISYPSSDQESWGVWSDKESCLSTVHLVLEICNLHSVRNITTLLPAISKAISKSQEQNQKGSTADMNEDSAEDYPSDDEEEEDYYGEEDLDCTDEESTSFKENEEEKKLAASFHNSQGSESAVKRLVKDLKALSNSKTKSGIDASPFENDLFIWRVKLTGIPLETQLGKDLRRYSKKYKEEPVIHLEMQFPPDYPFSPPFIRVLKPRFQFLTGHVTIGGSICMQMLTKSGWQPTNDIESILIQVRAEILSDPEASLAYHETNVTYPLEEAKSAFIRMTQKYGW